MSNESFLPISLPSKCIPYGGIQPEDITIRAYEGKDEIFLSEINSTNLSQKFLMVLKNVIQGIDPKKLTLGDRMYIMMWEYINSYSDSIKLKTVCSHCLKDIDVSVSLLGLEKIELPDDFKQPHLVKLPVSGKEVHLRVLTIEDEIETEKFEEKNPDGYLYRYARSIVNKDEDVFKRMEFLSNLKSKDMLLIRAFHEKYFHGVSMNTVYTCPRSKCGEEDEIEIPFRFDFLFPDGPTLIDAFGKGV